MSNIAKLLSEQLTDTWKDAQGLPDENTIRGLLEVGSYSGEVRACSSQPGRRFKGSHACLDREPVGVEHDSRHQGVRFIIGKSFLVYSVLENLSYQLGGRRRI